MKGLTMPTNSEWVNYSGISTTIQIVTRPQCYVPSRWQCTINSLKNHQNEECIHKLKVPERNSPHDMDTLHYKQL